MSVIDHSSTEGGDPIVAGEYVLGVLDASERSAVAQRIEREPDFAREVAFWEERLGGFADEVRPVTPPEGSGASTSPHAQAILSDPVEIDQVLLQQDGDAVGEQLVQEVEVADAKIGQGMVIDRDPATEPAKAMMVQAQPVQGAGAANALDGGVEPQGHPDLRIGGGASGSALHSADVAEEGRQVEALDELPDGPGVVFGGQEVFQQQRRQQDVPVGPPQARGRFGGGWSGRFRRWWLRKGSVHNPLL